MKEIKDKKEETIIRYQAEDGTIFNSRSECEKYDNTAECILKSRLKIEEVSEWDLVFGSDDNIVEVVRGKSNDVKMYASLRNNNFCKAEDFIKEELKDSDIPLFFNNCEGVVYRIITLDNFISQIKNLCKDE